MVSADLDGAGAPMNSALKRSTSRLKSSLACFSSFVAIARPSGKWAGLLETARQSAGTLTYPMADGSEGADAMESTPELANWLASLYPSKQLVICSYIYQGATCLSSHLSDGSDRMRGRRQTAKLSSARLWRWRLSSPQ